MDAAVANRFLASMFGPDRAAAAPDSWEVALFVGDPLLSGVEQDGPGYARVSLDADSFPAFAALTDGTTSALVSFGAATGEWPNESTHWALYTAAGKLGPTGELGRPVEVGEAGTFPPVLITVFINDVSEGF